MIVYSFYYLGCLRFYSKVPLKWINLINAEYLSSAVEFCLERSRCCFSVLEVTESQNY